MFSRFCQHAHLVAVLCALAACVNAQAADLVVDDTTFVLEGSHHFDRIEVIRHGKLLLCSLGRTGDDTTSSLVQAATIFAQELHVDSTGCLAAKLDTGYAVARLFYVTRAVAGTLDVSKNIFYDALPTVPDLVWPPAQAALTNGDLAFEVVGTDLSLEHELRPDSLTYRIEVSTDHFESLCDTFDQAAGGVGWTDTPYVSGARARYTPLKEFLPGAYQWRCFANDGHAWGPPSEVRTFFVDDSPPLGAPDAPQDTGLWCTVPEVRFEWSQGAAHDPETGIRGYRLAIGTAPLAADVLDQQIGDTSSYTFEHVAEGVTYFARVAAVNGAGLVGDWSSPSDGITPDSRADPPCITCPTHNDQSQWYQDNSPEVVLGSPEDVSGIVDYYYAVDRSSDTLPSARDSCLACTSQEQSLFLPRLEDGIWALHVVSRDRAGNLGSVAAHYTFRIDTTPPSIDHVPLDQAPVGQPIPVSVVIKDEAGAVSCRLYYRYAGATDFAADTMRAGGQGTFFALLPPLQHEGQQIEYYLEATDAAGHHSTLPGDNPAAFPLRVVGFSSVEAEIVASEGAHIELPDGDRIVIPPNALRHNVFLSASPLDETPDLPAELLLLRPALQISMYPAPELDLPVTIVLAWADTAAGGDEATGVFVRTEGDWAYVQCLVDTVDRCAVIQTVYFHDNERPVIWCVARDVLGPRIQLASPADSARVPSLFTVQVAVADSGSGVDAASVSMTMDGRPVPCEPHDVSAGSFSAALAEAEGLHTLSVSARDQVGNRAIGTCTFEVVLPSVSDLQAVPDTVCSGDAVVLSARASTDVSTIMGAEWLLGDDEAEGGMPLAAADGAFDGPQEVVQITVVLPEVRTDTLQQLRVRAQDALGCWGSFGRVSVFVKAFVDTLPPQMPQRFSATADPSAVVLAWQPLGEELVRYVIYTGEGQPADMLAVTADTTYADTSVAAGQSCTYWVACLDTCGNVGAPAGPVTVNLPLPAEDRILPVLQSPPDSLTFEEGAAAVAFPDTAVAPEALPIDSAGVELDDSLRVAKPAEGPADSLVAEPSAAADSSVDAEDELHVAPESLLVSEPEPLDVQGPEVLALAIVPDSVLANDTFTVTAVVSDSLTGGGNVHAAEYVVSAAGLDKMRGLMGPWDGVFDEPTETVEIVVSLEPEVCTEPVCAVSVWAQDDLGNWGSRASDSLFVLSLADTTPPSGVDELAWSDVVADESGKVSLSWASSTASDVLHYLIYRSDTLFVSTVGLEPLAATVNTTFTDSIGNAIPRFYAIAPVDSAGNLYTKTAAIGPVTAADDMPPTLIFESLIPAPGQPEVSPYGPLTFDLADYGAGIDASSIEVAVNGKTYAESAAAMSVAPGSLGVLHVTLQPEEALPQDDTVVVRIRASDQAALPNAMEPLEYRFITGPSPVIEEEATPSDTLVVSSADRMAFLVVPRALSDTAGVSLVSVHQPPEPAEGLAALGEAYRIVTGQQWGGAAQLGLRLATFQGSVAGLRMLRLDEQERSWQEVPCQVNLRDSTVVTQAAPGAVFQLMGMTEAEPPYLAKLSPEPGATHVPRNAPITFRVTDDLAGVDSSSVTLTVNGQIVEPGDLALVGPPSEAAFCWDGGRFGYGDTVRVRIQASDRALAPNPMEADAWFVVVPDTTAPSVQLLAPQADTSYISLDASIEWRLADPETGIDLSSFTLVANEDSLGTDALVVQADSAQCTLRFDAVPTIASFGDSVRLLLRVSDCSAPANTARGSYLFVVPPDTTAPVLAGLSELGTLPELDSLRFSLLDLEAGTDVASILLSINDVAVPESDLVAEGDPSEYRVLFAGALDSTILQDTVYVQIAAQDRAPVPNQMQWNGVFVPPAETSVARLVLVGLSEPLVAGGPADVVVRAEVEDEQAGRDWTVYLLYKRAGEPQFAFQLMARNESGCEASIPSAFVTSRGVAFCLEAYHEADTLIYPPERERWAPVCPEVRVPDEQTAGILMAGDGSDQITYAMLSVPILLDDPSPISVFGDDVAQSDPGEWRMLRYSLGEYTEYPYVGDIAPGRAFWVGCKGSRFITLGSGRSCFEGEDLELLLEPGWNQIGLPFDFPVGWEDILQSNPGVRVEAPWAYAGGYIHDVAVLRPWEGYWIRNLSDETVTLSIPAEESTAVAGADRARLSEAPEGWTVRVAALGDSAADADNFIGCKSGASDEWDEHDFAEPPPIGRFVSVSFPHLDWPSDPERYAGDFRPLGRSSYVWPVEIRGNCGGALELTFEGTSTIPDGMELVLADSVMSPILDLREKWSYVLMLSPQETVHLMIVAQSGEEMAEEPETSAQVEPPRLGNYPNPFNEATTVTFHLPRPERGDAMAHCIVAVYNMLGQEVRRLVDDELGPGQYSVVWDGLDFQGQPVGNGTYFCKLVTHRFHLMKRMIFLK